MKSSNLKKAKKVVSSAKLSLKRMVSDVKDPAAIIGGLVIGKVAADLIDKAMTQASTVKGLSGIKSAKELVTPAILVVGGLAAKQMLKSPIAKNIGIGVASYGGAVAVNSIVNLPALSSFTSTSALPKTTTTTTNGMGTVSRMTLPGTRQLRDIAPRSGVIL